MSKIDVSVSSAPQASDSLEAWLTFGSSSIASLAWPLTVIALVLILRRHVPGLLKSLKRLKGPGFEAEFERAVEDLAMLTSKRPIEPQFSGHPGHWQPPDLSPESEPEPAPDSEDGHPPGGDEQFPATKPVERSGEAFEALYEARRARLNDARALVSDSGRAAVLLAWSELEGAIREVAKIRDVPSGLPINNVIRELTNRDLMSTRLEVFCLRLLQLRAKASHDPSVEVDASAALTFVELVDDAMRKTYQIVGAGWDFITPPIRPQE